MGKRRLMRVGAALLGLQAAVFAYFCYAYGNMLPIASRMGPDARPMVLNYALVAGTLFALTAVLAVLTARGSVIGLRAAVLLTACESLLGLLWAAVGFGWGPVVGMLYLVMPLPFSAPPLLAWPALAVFVVALRRYRSSSPFEPASTLPTDSPADTGASGS